MKNEVLATIKTTDLINFVKGLAKLFGKNTEIVAHDLHQGKIVHIENGYITGRTVESPEDNKYIQTILSLAGSENCLIGFSSSASKDVKPLRTSHFVFHDESGNPSILLCINQDLEAFSRLRNQLDTFLETRSLEDYLDSDKEENYIHNITKRVIFKEVEQVKPSGLSSKTTKLRVIDALDQKGIFDVKDAVGLICDQLSISQATLYNYLREVRQNR